MSLKGKLPDNPKYYFFRYQRNRKLYFLIGQYDTPIAVGKIPSEIVPDIEPHDPVLELSEQRRQLSDRLRWIQYIDRDIADLKYKRRSLLAGIKRLEREYGVVPGWREINPKGYYRHRGKIYSYQHYLTIEDANLLRRDTSKEVNRPVHKKSELPKELDVSQITEFQVRGEVYSKRYQRQQLLVKLEKKQKERAKEEQAQRDIEYIVNELSRFINPQDLDSYSERKKQKNAIREELEQEFEDFFRKNYSWYRYDSFAFTSPNLAKETLEKFSITNRKEWLRWLRDNHPDKGGNTADCQKVIDAGRKMGY